MTRIEIVRIDSGIAAISVIKDGVEQFFEGPSSRLPVDVKIGDLLDEAALESGMFKRQERTWPMPATKDKETRLLISELCPECEGEGSYYSPQWKEWNEEHDKAEKEAEKEIQAKLGVSDNYRSLVIDRVEAILKERGIETPEGPEEPSCCECEGAGRRKRSVTLAELAELMGSTNGSWSFPAQYDAEYFSAKMKIRPGGGWIVDTFKPNGAPIGHTEAKTQAQAWFLALSHAARASVEQKDSIRNAVLKVLQDLARIEDLCSPEPEIRDMVTKVYKALNEAV